MKKRELKQVYNLYFEVARRLSEDLSDTEFDELEIGRRPEGYDKFEIKRGISYLSKEIAEEIEDTSSIEIYSPEKRDTVYESESLSMIQGPKYKIDFEEGKIGIGLQSRKKWEVMEALTDGREFEEALNEVMAGNSPKSSLNMESWEALLDQDGTLKERYRDDLTEILDLMYREGKIDDVSDFHSLRPPYVRPGVVDALEDVEYSVFRSGILNTHTDNWRVGQFLSDLEQVGFLKSDGSGYRFVDENRIEELRPEVEEIYEQRINNVSKDFDDQKIVEEFKQGFEVLEDREGRLILEGEASDYRTDFLDFMGSLGVLDHSTLEVNADKTDIEFIEDVLNSEN